MSNIATETPAAAPQPAQDTAKQSGVAPDTQDRTERFCKRLDEHLGGLPRAERLPFLERQRGVWDRRFEDFQSRVERGEAPEWGETAFDYRLTIDEISLRISREREAVPDYAQDGFGGGA